MHLMQLVKGLESISEQSKGVEVAKKGSLVGVPRKGLMGAVCLSVCPSVCNNVN